MRDRPPAEPRRIRFGLGAAVRRCALGLCMALAAGLALGQAASGPPARSDPLPVPALSGRVVDRVGLLPPDQAAALESRLARLERERGSQVAVLIVDSSKPEDLAAFAQRVGEQWQIGRPGVGDGLLIVVAAADRRVNIQVAKALEGAVPDLAARQIIDRELAPSFRAGDYGGGLLKAVDALDRRIAGEGLPAPPAPDSHPGGSGGLDLEGLIGFLFMAVPIAGAVLVGLFGRRLGALLAGALGGVLGWWLTSSLLIGAAAAVVAAVLIGVFGSGLVRGGRLASGRGGRSGGPIVWGGGGGSFGGGGGGGFRSGGGGDFGGGGASGSW